MNIMGDSVSTSEVRHKLLGLISPCLELTIKLTINKGEGIRDMVYTHPQHDCHVLR